MLVEKVLLGVAKVTEPSVGARVAADAASAGVVVSAFAGWLPVVSAVLAIPAACYYLILAIEKITGKPFHEWLNK